ncbi:MAG: histidine kinase, partial [Alteromonas sp.]|nr:histidine kinase [Alteromonas sp.]
KQLVELMGGNICAQSELGVGSTFTFRLPLVPAIAPMSVEKGKPVQLPSMHILIVDDIAQNIDLLSLLLSRSGHTVEVARDGQEALEKMKLPGIELVLMDLQMPVLDGLEASIQRRTYEAQHNLPPLPIIALTASVLVQDRHAATDAGMDGFANKPIDYPVLTREMARVLGKEIDESATLVVNDDKSEKPKLSKVVDVNRAIMLWGDAQTHRNEVARFTRENEAKVAQITTAILDNDAAKTASLAHGIKGVAGNLCLNPLMSVCRDIEKNAHAGELDISTVQLLKKSFNEVITWLQGTSETKTVHVKQDVNYTVLLEHLAKLKQSVEQNMLDEDELQEVKTLAGGEYKDTIASIIMDIDDFEFERAEAQLVELIDTLATETETQ